VTITDDVSLRLRGGRRGSSIIGRLLGVVAALLGFVTAYAYLWACRRVGPRARTLGRPRLRHPANIEIGRDAIIDSRAARVELASEPGGRLVIGNGVRIGAGTRLAATRYVEIGDGARIGARCFVSDAGEADAASTEETAIWVGDEVTLGDGVEVRPGTVIGAGAVILAGAVVSGEVPAGAVVGDAAPREAAR
jgi:acetyltransferase-like isoleucine patch superfamily enzyme